MTEETVRVSVIVPIYNASRHLSECLFALLSSPCAGQEIIAVDDASTDDTPAVAEQFGVRLLRLAKNLGPSGARNYGARHAKGEVIIFVDADVVVAPGLLSRVLQIFDSRPEIAAVFGSYDAFPRAQGVVSQFRNLLHHYVHQNGNPDASTFWAGCGAIRRCVFDTIGGFDEKRYPRPSIEDIELGYRLRQAGYHILLDKTLQGTHLKRWTLWSVIRTDIQCRAIPWARLMLETKRTPNDLNIRTLQRLSGGLVILSCLFSFLGALKIEMLALAAFTSVAVVILNRELYKFLLRQGGPFFATACVPLHFLYFFYSTLTYLFVWALFRLKGAVAQLARS